MKQLNDGQLRPKINTTMNAVSYVTVMAKHYTVHRLRSMVQFDIIDKTKNECLKGGKSIILILLDRKQQVLGMIFCEGKVEYFVTYGISILGSMEFQWEESSNGPQSQEFYY